MIDVLIQTYNEELNLPHALASVKGWSNRVFVVDSGSTDRTVEIAKEAGATVVHHPWEGYARQKNWAIENLPWESRWILILDADEAVTPELRDELMKVTSASPDAVPQAGFYINRIFIFMGRQIRHCGYFPSWNLRLFKRGRARYEDRKVHEHMIVSGSTGHLEHLLLHEDRRGFEHFIAKHNRYSTLEAQESYRGGAPWPGWRAVVGDGMARRRFLKTSVLPRLPLPWLWKFLYMYVIKLGFLDGRAGWNLCIFISSYEFFIQAKFAELRRLRPRNPPVVAALSVPEGELPLVEATAKEAHDNGARRTPSSATPQTRSRFTNSSAGSDTRAPFTGPSVPTLRGPAGGTGEPKLERSPWSLRDKMKRVLWMFARGTLFRWSFHNWYAWRRLLLRAFGAKIGRNVAIRPTVVIEIPWNLRVGDHSVVGDHAILYCLGTIEIGRQVVISQYAHLCAGTHDFRDPTFPLLRPPIVIHDHAWIAADAFVGPGVTVGRRAVVGARASAFSDIPENTICVGNPAKPRGQRDPVAAPPEQRTLEDEPLPVTDA